MDTEEEAEGFWKSLNRQEAEQQGTEPQDPVQP